MAPWVELVLNVTAFLGCGAFFAWVTRSLLRLRAHEHRQNNAMTAQMLLLGEIAKRVGVDAKIVGTTVGSAERRGRT